jgi:hypothetical protein
VLDTIRQRILDEEHLRLLRICYFIMAGTAGFAVFFGGLYLVMGFFMAASFSSMPQQPAVNAPPAFVGWLFAAIGGFIVILAGGGATLCLLTGRDLGRRQSRTLCFITAGLCCLQIPFGTALGIFTFVVLGRPSVQALFLNQTSPMSPDPPGTPPLPPVQVPVA